MQRSHVIDEGVGGAPPLGAAVPVAAFAALMLGMPPFVVPGIVATAAVGYAAFRMASWRLASRVSRVTFDEESATFARGGHIEDVERALVERWSVATRDGHVVVLAHLKDGGTRELLAVGPRAEAHLRRIVALLETSAAQARPEGGYRRAPDAARRGGEVKLVWWPAGARRRRAVALALLVGWTVLWTAALIIFAQDGPEIPWLAHGAAALGSLALATIAGMTLREPSDPEPKGFWSKFRLPRSPALAWPLAVIFAATSLWSFVVVTRPLDVDGNREACGEGDADACWYVAHRLLRESRDEEALSYLERACRGGRGRACSYRAERMEKRSPKHARSMLERGCELGDVASCSKLASLLGRQGDAAGAEAARARWCEIDPRRCDSRR